MGLGPSALAALSSIYKTAGSPVKLFENGVGSFGVDNPVTSYATAGGVEVYGVFDKVQGRGLIEQLTNALSGGPVGEPKKLEQSFSFSADQITFTPTTNTKLITPGGESWQVLQDPLSNDLNGVRLDWTLIVRQIR